MNRRIFSIKLVMGVLSVIMTSCKDLLAPHSTIDRDNSTNTVPPVDEDKNINKQDPNIIISSQEEYDGLNPDFFVSSSGSDSNIGKSENTAFSSLEKAWSMASAGQVIGVVDSFENKLDLSVIENFPGNLANHIVTVGKLKHTKIIGGVENGGNDLPAYHEFRNIHFDGLNTISSMYFSLQWVKFVSCVFEASGSAIRGNNATHTAGSNQLYESCGFIGNSGRYATLCYQKENTLYRWCLVRTEENVWTVTNEDTQGGLQIYISHNCAVIQTVAIDCLKQGSSGSSAGVFSNATNQGDSLGCEFIGIIATDSPYTLVSPGGISATDLKIIDPVLLRGKYGIVVEGKGPHNGQSISVEGGHIGHMTFAALAGYSGGRISASNINAFDNGEESNTGVSFSGINTNNTTTASSIIEGINKIGVSGTYRGEIGWKELQNVKLFPFPGEAELRFAFRNYDDRGFCADGQSLTAYLKRE